MALPMVAAGVTLAARVSRASLVSAVVPSHGHSVSIVLTSAVDGLSAADFTITANGVAKHIGSMTGGGTRWNLMLDPNDWILSGETVLLSYDGLSRITQFSGTSVTNGSLVNDRGVALVQRQRSFSLHFNIATYTIPLGGTQQAPAGSNPDLFNPTGLATAADLDNWIDAAVAFGSETIMLTAKHSDGFCLWASTASADRCIIASTPWWGNQGFDIVAAFIARARLAGIRVGFYFCIWDTTFEQENPSSTDEEYTNFTLDHLSELLGNYGEIDELVFDAWAGINSYPSYTKVNKEDVLALVQDLQPDCTVLINDYNGQLLDADVNLYENGLWPEASFPPIGNQYPARLWLTPTNDGNSWFDDTAFRASYKTAEFQNGLIADSHARNCEVMFNLSPDTTGLIDSGRIAYLASLNP